MSSWIFFCCLWPVLILKKFYARIILNFHLKTWILLVLCFFPSCIAFKWLFSRQLLGLHLYSMSNLCGVSIMLMSLPNTSFPLQSTLLAALASFFHNSLPPATFFLSFFFLLPSSLLSTQFLSSATSNDLGVCMSSLGLFDCYIFSFWFILDHKDFKFGILICTWGFLSSFNCLLFYQPLIQC